MEQEVQFRIIVENAFPNVTYGLQKGKVPYETIQKQKVKSGNMNFEFPIIVKQKEKEYSLTGPFVQGPKDGKFIYLDIGTYAGEHTEWARRLKIPLTDITNKMIQSAIAGNKHFETTVPGKGKDGGPNCATVKPFNGWKLS